MPGTRPPRPRRVASALAYLSLATGLLCLPAVARAAGPPTIAATWATAVTVTSANLHAELDPQGLPTTYRFEYLTEAAYLANGQTFAGAAESPPNGEAGLSSASGEAEAFQHLGSLQPATTYRYRILATSHCLATEPAQLCIAGGSQPPHRFTTSASGAAFALPDRRAWELVSPLDKNGGEIQGPGQNSGGDVLQAAAQGGTITYSSASSFAAAAQGAPPASQYLSRRSATGWSTENITPPALSGSYGNLTTGVPYQLFSPDLARGLLLNGRHCRGESGACPIANPPLPASEAPAGYQDYYLRDESGSFTALITHADADLGLSPEDFDLSFAGASPDLRHVVLSTCAALTPEATEVPSGGGGCVPAETNLYEWSGGALSLINAPAGHHAGLAARTAAIGADGRRVYFTEGEDSPILLREEGQPTKSIGITLGGVGSFQTASADGSFAFFTVAGDLYRYDALTEASSEPLATEVLGVLGASEDGSHVYYVTASGLFLWRSPGTTTEVASGPEAAAPSEYPPSTGSARTSADGTHLAFLSSASLTGYDNTDQQTGEPDSEVYLYDAARGGGGGTLVCASCNPTGERPLGPSTIPGATANGDLGEDPTATDSYKPRVLAADGERLFFDSADSLVPSDTDSAPDVYEWEAQGQGSCAQPAGCLGLISSGRGSGGASFVDASADGADAYFLTAESLLPSDPGSVDLYDARVGGGFPEPPPPIECDGDACQPLPSAPEDPTPATVVLGPGNLPVHFPKSHHKKSHHKKHRHKRSHGARRGADR